MIRLIISLVIALFLLVTNAFSQKVTGDWYGQLDIHGKKLKINFHVSEKEGIYSTTMDSPDQGAMEIPTDKTEFSKDTILISLKSMGILYKGKLKKEIIEGIFTQGGMDLPLKLTKHKVLVNSKTSSVLRPQDPKKPFNYKSEEVTFINKKANNIKLAGTLTLPKGVKNPSVAILISGSGPQNRDEELLNHRPFLVLSDYLTTNGIAILRFDDRGIAKSEGIFKNATSADFATDVESAVAYLQTRTDVNANKIGLIGHSEGGFIAPMVASKNKKIAFIVLLAGPGVFGAEILRTQTKKAMELAHTDKDHILFNDKMMAHIFELIKKESNLKKLEQKVDNYLKGIKREAPESLATTLTDDAIKKQIKSLTSPWFTYFIKTDPKQFLNEVSCPVLAINGEKDFQVLPKLNLKGIKNALNKSKDVTILELEGLNHLFQTCETGAFSEYEQIEETFSPKALKIIGDWIKERF